MLHVGEKLKLKKLSKHIFVSIQSLYLMLKAKQNHGCTWDKKKVLIINIDTFYSPGLIFQHNFLMLDAPRKETFIIVFRSFFLSISVQENVFSYDMTDSRESMWAAVRLYCFDLIYYLPCRGASAYMSIL